MTKPPQPARPLSQFLLALLFSTFLAPCQAQESVPAPLKALSADLVESQTVKAPSMRAGQYIVIRLSLKNSSDLSYILDGDRATIVYENGSQTAPSEKKVAQAAQNILLPGKVMTLGVVSLGTLGLGGQITYEILTNSREFPYQYGKDATRRNIEEHRLGKRLMLPSEACDADIFLPAASGHPQKILIPVFLYPGQESVGQLTVPLTAAKNI